MAVTDTERGSFDSIILALDRYEWQAFVNTVMSIRVSSDAVVSFLTRCGSVRF